MPIVINFIKSCFTFTEKRNNKINFLLSKKDETSYRRGQKYFLINVHEKKFMID